MIQRDRLLERFLKYVRVGSAADPHSTTYPSSPGQLLLGKLLAEELIAMGATDVEQDCHGLVWATVNPTGSSARTVLLNAHVDTSPEAPGDGCNPTVVSCYDGGKITIGNGISIDPADSQELNDLIGHTLITTDGSTLLGGDDKAGVAVIMEVAQSLLENPNPNLAPLRVLFTCDEEIGAGTKHLDVAKVNACVGYTLDGGGAGTIDVETFSADMAIVRFQGRNTHPSVGKGKMINSLRALGAFLADLPHATLSPETTADREGFIHPYHISGGVQNSEVHLILRDFQTSKLASYADLLRVLAQKIEENYVGVMVSVEIREQYRNMGDVLTSFPLAADLAEQAFKKLGRPCRRDIIRGGTDGALMSAMGLPTPNLSVGQYNIHSVREYVSLNQMMEAAEHALSLLELWGDP
ncbi:MAG: peptidase T [Pirellula sp.]|nr:peptidase T [Pirellula sp.]